MSDDGYVTKMSGVDQHWGGGATRDSNDGKPRFEMSPPRARRRVADVYARGAVNRGAMNFAQGIPTMRCLESAMRHIEQGRAGEVDEDHFAQAVWNLEVLMHFQGTDWDDLFDWTVPDRPAVVEAVELEADPELLAGVSRGFGVERSLAPGSPTWGDLGAQVGDLAATAVHVGWLWFRRHI